MPQSHMHLAATQYVQSKLRLRNGTWRIWLGVDWKIPSIRKEPILSGFLTLDGILPLFFYFQRIELVLWNCQTYIKGGPHTCLCVVRVSIPDAPSGSSNDVLV